DCPFDCRAHRCASVIHPASLAPMPRPFSTRSVCQTHWPSSNAPGCCKSTTCRPPGRNQSLTARGASINQMRHNTDRILVSHAGNLPRPDYLDELIEGGKAREGSNRREYHERLPRAVNYIVDRQIELGVDIVNDGEYAKAGSYGGYMQERGWGGRQRPE